MAYKNCRTIEKDLFADLVAAQGGDSEIIDFFGRAGGTEKYTCQFVYDVLSFSAAAVASATNIFDQDDPDNPSQFEKTAHGFVTGLKVQVATSDTLPDPLVALTDYFVIKIDDDFFQLAADLEDALAGIPINLVDVGVGTQTVTAVALAGGSVKLQKSNDSINWVDVQTATSVSADGTVMITAANVAYRYVKAVKALTAGAFEAKALLLVIGDAI